MKKKSGWDEIESAPSKRAAKKEPPKHPYAKSKPKKAKEQKPPYGVLVGRTDGEKYEFTRESFGEAQALTKYVTKALLNETYATGLREVMIHLRREA